MFHVYAFKFNIHIMGNDTSYSTSSFGLTIKRAVFELQCVCKLVTTWGFMLASKKKKKEEKYGAASQKGHWHRHASVDSVFSITISPME